MHEYEVLILFKHMKLNSVMRKREREISDAHLFLCRYSSVVLLLEIQGWRESYQIYQWRPLECVCFQPYDKHKNKFYLLNIYYSFKYQTWTNLICEVQIKEWKRLTDAHRALQGWWIHLKSAGFFWRFLDYHTKNKLSGQEKITILTFFLQIFKRFLRMMMFDM